MPGSPITFDCTHTDSPVAVQVSVIGGDTLTVCPRCAGATVETALEAGVDERCILIQQAPIAPVIEAKPCDHEAEHRARWGSWADQRITPGFREEAS
jgi:hypothetical protein